MSISSLLTTLLPTGSNSSPSEIKQAEIKVLDYNVHSIYCQFNPFELTIVKEATWSSKTASSEKEKETIPQRNAPDLNFAGGGPATFSLNLVFDTTRESSSSEQDVRKYTNELLKLTLMGGGDNSQKFSDGRRKPPPRVQFIWGSITLFIAVVTKVSITYTMFQPNGRPVRARAAVDFSQLDPADDSSGTTNPTSRTEPRKTRIIQMGDRLDMIAYQEYGHPSHWRYLAEVNDIHDPRTLFPGQIIIIPPLP